jgi:DNA-binding transcriptional MerR regulator/methylmalonyl-CoA mutase cobalamin-binding subunit
MAKDPDTPQFPVRVVVRRTGLNPSLLRAWERRYGVVTPSRTDGGQRLYSEADVQRLILLRAAVSAGHNISQIASLTDERLRGLNHWSPEGAGEKNVGVVTQAGGFLADALGAIEGMDTQGLETTLHRAAMALPSEALVDEVLVPLLRDIGLHWRKGTISPAAEHLASAVLRRFLDWLVTSLTTHQPKGLVLVGTPAGQQHEFGSLLAAVVVAAEGWRVLALGSDLPASEILLAVRRKGADMVALSALHPPDEVRLVDEVRHLCAGAPPGVRVLIGGPAATAARTGLEAVGAEVMVGLDSLRGALRPVLV